MENVFVAEKISKRRLKKGREEFYVKWKGWSPNGSNSFPDSLRKLAMLSAEADTREGRHSTWEPIENILDHNLIRLFEKEEQEQIASGAIRKRKNRRFHFPLDSNADDAGFSNEPLRSEEVLSAKQSPVDHNKNQSPDDLDHSCYEEASTSPKFHNTSMHNDPPSVELNALSTNDKVIKERLHKKLKLTKTKPNFDGQTSSLAGIAKRRPRRSSKNPWRQAIIPALKPECHVPEREAAIDTDWTKQELVITDVTMNSQTITFIQCDSEDHIFNDI